MCHANETDFEQTDYPIADETFDINARHYHEELNRGISLSGESADFFAENRVKKTVEIASSHGIKSFAQVLDFGCGIGTAAPFLSVGFPNATITGSDVAAVAIDRAIELHKSPQLKFVVGMQSISKDTMDLAYCNGVFHHIAPSDRDITMQTIYDAMKPGGIFCLWENNPWNPGTQMVMRRIPFDRDAICLSVLEAKRRMLKCGFVGCYCRSYFYFPACLSALRRFEDSLSSIPLGAQYVCVGIKPNVK